MKNSASAPKYAVSATPLLVKYSSALRAIAVGGSADHNQRRRLRERVHQRRLRVRDQQHIAFVDRRPAADARSIHSKAVHEAALVQLAEGVGNMMLQARNIGEPQIQLLGIVLLGKFQNFFRSHSSSRIKLWEL